MKEKKVFRFRPSAASRWLNCTASVKASEGVPEAPSSEYANEGTAAHTLAEWSARFDTLPREFIGQEIEVEGQKFLVTEELAGHVEGFLEFQQRIPAMVLEEASKGRAVEYSLGDFEINRYFEISLESAGGNVGGTSDLVIVLTSEKYRVAFWAVVDLKFGAGVSVEVVDNPQLLNYAALAAQLIPIKGYILGGALLAIYQPRAIDGNPERIAWATSGELLVFMDRVTKAIEEAEEGGTFRDGPWCRWCPIKAACPHLHELAVKQAALEFSEPPITEGPLVSSPGQLSAERVEWWLRNGDRLVEFVKAVWEHAAERAKAGESFEGYKLVEKLSNRRWAGSEEEVEKALRKLGIKKADLYERKLVSPAEAEKIGASVKSKKEAIAAVELLTKREVTGLDLVPLTDKRPAFVRSTPADDFGPGA